MKIAKKDAKKLKTQGTWKASIIEFLMNNNGATDIEVYDATRPDRRDISDQKKRHNVASQLTYLRNDDYLVMKEETKVFLLATPDPKDTESLNVVPGMETKIKELL